jgi:purine nucleosidase
MRIFLDTDIGTDVDDALALAMILGSPELDLVGISTVYGDTLARSTYRQDGLSPHNPPRV